MDETANEAIARDMFRWQRLNPGQGVILTCARCGAMAHTSGLPEGYPGVNGAPRYLIGSGRVEDVWRERHECDPTVVARIAEWVRRNPGDILPGDWCARYAATPERGADR